MDEALEIIDEFNENTKDTEVEILADFITRKHIEAIMEVLEVNGALKLSEENLARLNNIVEQAGLKKKYVEEAVEEGRFEIARKMLRRGVKLEYIAEDTDLPIDKIQELAQSIQSQQ